MPQAILARIPSLQNRQTGPRTTAGKERSSANATLHGGTSKKLIVTGESQADFDVLLNGLLDEYQPGTMQSRLFVEELALAQWFLWRRHRAHNAIEAAIYENQPDESQWTESDLHRLALADRYRTQAERAFKRALTNLENWRKENRREEQCKIRNTQWAAAHSIRDRRMTLAERQFAALQAFRFANTADAPLNSPTLRAATPETPR
jgi:hypothetical protein